ncbi:FcoT family thioesterase [Corynebacterium sp.]|uniref:FcoT family thioesterase n=1 Tax=Corynebacterium sp. TaxID=1720 RepID=UPI002648296F|nr:FcoT family thioesterase [Corynebacterium sp.]MDN5721494.1 FcoT family thioesterase [Corynebacterium sp.]MDN6281626.1 FcoT family thioesterase [Corynebacterium sp.]MDN6352300.1 FcoT family thioesterase [Corynebacterium sp.]MDN6367345.1 FcoT family thioesterase [Corynebacterium sp.]MDN6374873.1 FcoT family thioesterase [Corynebacterium sp.]
MSERVSYRPGDDLFDRVVAPYRAKGSIYLTTCDVDTGGGDRFAASGDFRISESCYIDDTGHFNAAEFIICYNQLMYAALAAVITEGNTPAFSGWTIADYWERQLPNVLIQELWSRYSRPINARSFSGSFRVNEIDHTRRDRGIVKLDTVVEFTDDNGGRARGNVLLALTDVPERARL